MYNQDNLASIPTMISLAPEVMKAFPAFDKAAGATDVELTETAMVAASLRAGAAVTQATHALAN